MSELFPEVIGHEGIKERVYSILTSDNIPHAFLFSGKEGIGKFNFALEILKFLSQRFSPDDNYALEQIKNLRVPYVNYIFPLPRGKNESAATEDPFASLDENTIEEIQNELKKKIENPYYEINVNGAQNIKISSIRAIKKSLSVNTTDIPYTGIIIDKAELMSVEAQNSLLKSLEEPPERVIFFVLTKDESLLLPTIKSRCWTINFANLSKREVENVLVKFFGLEQELVSRISPFANGSVKEASKFLQDNRFELLETTIDFLRRAIGGKYNEAVKLFNEMLDETDNDLELLINLITLWLEDALIEKNDGGEDYSYREYASTFEKFNKGFPNADIPQTINALQNTINFYKQNVSLKIILLNIIFLISSLGKRQL